jgi:glycosyltransferase involved in cell wall biosynthesis
MKSQPVLSVITVVYNNVRDIERTLLSVINQTYAHIEYIVIDGGSTDGTMDIINKYRDKIAKVVSEKDRGIYHEQRHWYDERRLCTVYELGR